MINDNYESVEVISADRKHLFFGLFSFGASILCGFFVVDEFLNGHISHAIIFSIFVLFFILYFALACKMYLRRQLFTMFFCALESANIAEIKKNYCICAIDEDGVIFIDENSKKFYSDWSFQHHIYNTKGIFLILKGAKTVKL